MEEKKYYIYGGFGLAIILLIITLFSFFSVPKYSSNSTVGGLTVINGKVEKKTYPKPDIVFISDNSEEKDHYIKLKFIKPSNLPSAVQSIIDSDFEREKSKASESIRIENSQPEIYQSDEYVSIVTVFSKYNVSKLIKKSSFCWTYSQETKNIVSLPQTLESENKNNEVYTYLVSVFKPQIARKTFELLKEINIGGSIENVEKKVADKLLPKAENFSTWYLDANQLFLIFDPDYFMYDDESSNFEEQKISVNFLASKTYLKTHSNSNK
ncbi:MAG: hypothetical protein WC472_00495 [Candidatus Paceibacterota bacterium]